MGGWTPCSCSSEPEQKPPPPSISLGFKREVELAEKRRHFTAAEMLRSHL